MNNSSLTSGRKVLIRRPGEGRPYPMGRISAIFKADGSFVLVPGGSTHDCENRGSTRAGALNFSAPGNFEQHMPAIAQWFADHPPGHAGG